MDANENIPLEDIFSNELSTMFRRFTHGNQTKDIFLFFLLKKTNNIQNELLIKEIETLENFFCQDSKTINTKKKNVLETLCKKKMECVYIRSRARWITEAERVTSYVCNLENRNFISKTISQIAKKNGSIITDKIDIMYETNSGNTIFI